MKAPLVLSRIAFATHESEETAMAFNCNGLQSKQN